MEDELRKWLEGIEKKLNDLIHIVEEIKTEAHDYDESEMIGRSTAVGEYNSRKAKRKRGEASTQPRK